MMIQKIKQSLPPLLSAGISCDVLDWQKENSARFPLIAKTAKIVLATLVSEAICQRLFKLAKHIGTTDRMERLLDNLFKVIRSWHNIKKQGVGALGRGGNRGEHVYAHKH